MMSGVEAGLIFRQRLPDVAESKIYETGQKDLFRLLS